MKKIKVRRFWKINPQTRIKESKKIYSRARERKGIRQHLKEVITSR